MELTLRPIINRLRRRERPRTPARAPTTEDLGRGLPPPTSPQAALRAGIPDAATYALHPPAHIPEPIRVKKPPPTGWRATLQKVVDAVTGNVVVARALGVVDIYGRTGAPLFASALAFSTLFALVPILLLLSGVLGWLVESPSQREALLNQLVGYLPPLADLFAASLEDVVIARGALSIVGLVGLVWGASAFYGSLDEVMRRLFPGGGARNEISRRIRGMLTIAILVALVAGIVSLSGLFAIVDDVVGGTVIWRYLLPLIALAVFVLVVLAVYLFVPTAPPTLRQALPPAIASGIGIGVLTSIFSLLAPVLIGNLSGFGVIATVFGVLIWLNFSYQVLLYGAAWARLRRDRARSRLTTSA